MSNFPYNADKYQHHEGDYNGPPFTFEALRDFVTDLMWWHSQDNHTSDWTQSNDGMEATIDHVTLGLVELLADPHAVRRLETTGQGVRKTLNTIHRVAGYDSTNPDDKTARLSEMLRKAGY